MPRTEVFRDSEGEWRWRHLADNGEMIATSGEGYKNRGHALEMADKLFTGEVSEGRVYEKTGSGIVANKPEEDQDDS